LFSALLSAGTDAIGKQYGINPSVRGATLDATASSFPEFCAVVFGLIAGSFEIGIGTIAGSALFNVLVIPTASAFVVKKLKVRAEVIRRDGVFYLIVVIGLVAAIWFGPERVTEDRSWRALPMWIGLVAVLVYVVYVALLTIHGRSKNSSPESRVANFSLGKIIAKIVVGIAGVGVTTHFLVTSSLDLFEQWGFSEAIAGVTIVAAATSLPDTLLSVYAAKRGDPDGAVANAFGSNTFDILICLGLPILVTGGVQVDWTNSWPILSFLLGSTLISITFLVTDWTLTRREAAFMGLIYVVFIILALTGVI